MQNNCRAHRLFDSSVANRLIDFIKAQALVSSHRRRLRLGYIYIQLVALCSVLGA